MSCRPNIFEHCCMKAYYCFCKRAVLQEETDFINVMSFAFSDDWQMG